MFTLVCLQVPIPAECVRDLYTSNTPQDDSLTVAKRQKHWEQIESDVGETAHHDYVRVFFNHAIIIIVCVGSAGR